MPVIPSSQSAGSGGVRKSRRKAEIVFRCHYTDGTCGEEERREVYAWVYNDAVAVHQGVTYPPPAEGTYSVSFLGCGLAACAGVKTEEDACRVAALLAADKQILQAARERNGNEAVRKCPPWLKAWLRACRDQGKWVEPAAYRK